MMNQFKSVWVIPFFLVAALIVFLSTRQLSDPDIGSHLKGGKWIVQNKAIPDKDTFTYTANSHDYIDMNWLFQVFVYLIFLAVGYKGLSILVLMFVLGLMCLLLIRNQRKKVPVSIAGFVFLIGFLVMETRISLRPELFTFLFLSLFLVILDEYYYNQRKLMFLLPVIMLFWCNIHGLFILGFALIGSYFISLVIRDKKIEKSFLLWSGLTILACFVNPYFVRGITFPLELFTRFDANNIFHTHIKELNSFYDLDKLFLKDIIFLVFLVMTFLSAVLTWKKRSFHEFFLLVVFACLAIVSVRNIALFAVIGMPVLCYSLNDISSVFHRKTIIDWLSHSRKFFRVAGLILLIILPLGLIARLITGAYYTGNHAYTKTGIGLDPRQLPEKAADFMLRNGLSGRIINGISLGGWLSWRLPQPVFIDGRLEVIREELYQELTDSWKSGLSNLADKYQADLIIYNYFKYYPWTVQLAGMNNWRLVYIDGLSVIFSRSASAEGYREINTDSICGFYGIPVTRSDSSIIKILQKKPPSSSHDFIDGFWKKIDLHQDDLLNIGSFFLQMKNVSLAEKFFLANLDLTEGRSQLVFYALADIYSARPDYEKASICYHRILSFDPRNEFAQKGLEVLGNKQKMVPANTGPANDAIVNFNSANEQYNKGNIQEALRLYDEAIRLYPGYFKAFNNRAIVKASSLKNYKDAIEDFTQAIGICPDYADAYLGRGASRLELKDLDGACSDWHQAAKLGNTKAEILIQRFCAGKR